jgi:hypothetical protein
MAQMSTLRGMCGVLPRMLVCAFICACHRAPPPSEKPAQDASKPLPEASPKAAVAQVTTRHSREELCRPWPPGVPCTYAGLHDEMMKRATPESGLAGEAGTCGALRYLAFGAPVGSGTIAYFDVRGELLSGATWLMVSGPYNATFGDPPACVCSGATSLSGALPAGKSSFFPRLQTAGAR